MERRTAQMDVAPTPTYATHVWAMLHLTVEKKKASNLDRDAMKMYQVTHPHRASMKNQEGHWMQCETNIILKNPNGDQQSKMSSRR